MKKHKLEETKIFILSAIGIFISSLSVYLLPFSENSNDEEITGIGILIGILFWVGIIMGSLFFLLVWRQLRKDEEYLEIKKRVRPGFLNFFSGRFAIINDATLIVSIVVVIVSVGIPTLPDGIILLGMFFMIYSFCLHFLLNGRVYKYLFRNLEKMKRRK